MKITPEFLLDLQSKARNATQGKWKVQVNAPLVVANDEQTFRVECAHKWGKVNQAVKDMEYIAAANPTVVLGLIAKIESLEKEADWLAEKCACQNIKNGCECGIDKNYGRNEARKAISEADNA